MRLGINGRFQAARLSGVQRVARELTAELQARTDAVLFLPAGAPEPEMLVRSVRGSRRGHAFEQLELNSLAHAHACDVLLHPANTAPLQGGPHIVFVHDVLPLTNPEWFTRKYVLWQRHVVRRALRNAAHICTCSTWSAGEIMRTCALPSARISVVPQGTTPFQQPASAADVRHARASFDLRSRYFLAVGWGDPRKNIAFLLPIVGALRARHDVQLVIVGAHQARVHRAPAAALPAWVRHIPQVSDQEMRALYTGARALCFPSLAEGYGRPPLEALACGTPAVVADYGSAREVLGAALEPLPLDSGLWGAALEQLLDDGVRAAQVTCAQPLLARLSWTAAAEAVLQIAQRVVVPQRVVSA